MRARAKVTLAAAAVCVIAGYSSKAATSTGTHPATTDVVVSAPQMSAASSNVALGKQMAAAAGWTGTQWSCLDALWTRESGWQTEVWNYGGSGAYGIPQALPASKMAAAGPDYMTNPATQISWGLTYIASRYGTPCGAWSHETSANWY
jgi:resuscitation-promoting factor RpfB